MAVRKYIYLKDLLRLKQRLRIMKRKAFRDDHKSLVI
tara:strand:+ start:486 stop:596 length:111 start_codon:yes stop_codon:yes gene_type:complete